MLFESLSIRGFRGFKSLQVENLERFSLFLGRNNVGKTALLESIYLLAGPTNPELSLRVNAFRGIDKFRGDPEEIWGWLFHLKNTREPIVLELKSGAARGTGKIRKLTLNVRIPKEFRVGKKRKSGGTPTQRTKPTATASTTTDQKELSILYETETGHKVRSRVVVTEDGLRMEREDSRGLPQSIFVTARGGYSDENPERWSKLEETGREGEILQALKILEPRLKRLSVLVKGAGPIIHGDIGIDRMVPLPMMGEGLGRLLTLLLAIASSEGGFVMVDEIDTGFHYSVIKDVWSAVATAARHFDVQVFATTHSWECLRAAHESFSESGPYDLRLHRIDRINSDVEAVTYDRAMIEEALSAGMELR